MREGGFESYVYVCVCLFVYCVWERVSSNVEWVCAENENVYEKRTWGFVKNLKDSVQEWDKSMIDALREREGGGGSILDRILWSDKVSERLSNCVLISILALKLPISFTFYRRLWFYSGRRREANEWENERAMSVLLYLYKSGYLLFILFFSLSSRHTQRSAGFPRTPEYSASLRQLGTKCRPRVRTFLCITTKANEIVLECDCNKIRICINANEYASSRLSDSDLPADSRLSWSACNSIVIQRLAMRNYTSLEPIVRCKANGTSGPTTPFFSARVSHELHYSTREGVALRTRYATPRKTYIYTRDPLQFMKTDSDVPQRAIVCDPSRFAGTPFKTGFRSMKRDTGSRTFRLKINTGTDPRRFWRDQRRDVVSIGTSNVAVVVCLLKISAIKDSMRLHLLMNRPVHDDPHGGRVRAYMCACVRARLCECVRHSTHA